MKMIESEGRASFMQALHLFVEKLRQRQKSLNTGFKISYKRILRKNHTSRLHKRNQLKRQKSCKSLPIHCPVTANPNQSLRSTRFEQPSQSCPSKRSDSCARIYQKNSAINCKTAKQFIHVPHQSEQSQTGITALYSQNSENPRAQASAVSRTVPSKPFRPPFLSRNKSERVIRLKEEEEEGSPQSDNEQLLFKQICQQNSSIRDNQSDEDQNTPTDNEMVLVRRIKELGLEEDWNQAFHERYIERVSWRRPGKSTFFFNRFKTQQGDFSSKRDLSWRDELSSAASSDDIVL